MAQLFATGIYTTLWTLPRRAENDSQTRDPHETKSHERTEFLVTKTRVNIRTAGARKPPMMTGFQAEENLTERAPKKCTKNSGRYPCQKNFVRCFKIAQSHAPQSISQASF